MNKQEKQRAILQKLRSLADQPGEQVRYALELLQRERGDQIVSSALEIITAAPTPEAHPLLLQLYDYYDANGVKRDPGGTLRSALIQALLPIAEPGDLLLAERAAQTYEFLPPGPREVTGGLRSAGLVLLSNLDPVLASYHCVRLLIDPYTSRMSGEPAVSAVQLLAKQFHPRLQQGYLLPLYQYIINSLHREQGIPEVVGECLRSLTAMPDTLIDNLFDRYTAISPRTNQPVYADKDDVELAGFVDLLLAHITRRDYLDFIKAFMQETQRYEVYRYLAAMIIAKRQSATWNLLLEEAHREQNQNKVEILLAAFTPVQNDAIVAKLCQELEQKVSSALHYPT